MVQCVESLTRGIEVPLIPPANVLEGRGVPVHVSWPLDRIPSFVREYLEPAKRIRLELRKRAYVEPFRRRTRGGIRIARYVGAVAGKSGNLRRLPLQ